MDHLVGQKLGRYQIISLLGEGGMGAVFKGRDETLKRDVAIKVMSPQLARQANFQERFLQEARTVARLSHPNIVQIYDFGQAESQLYIVMEFIPGKSLQQYLQELRAEGKWIELSEAVQLVRQVLLALDYGHKHGVLHRDLKPDNIMLKAEAVEGPYRPVITDLGLAKLAGGDVETQVGTAMGTPVYMSPEQALGQTAQVTSDIYSAGILLYEMAAGRPPFEVKTLVEAVKAHSQQTPPAPRSLKPELPEALEKVILKAIEKEPAKRFQEAAAMEAALENVLPAKPTVIGAAPAAASGGGTQFQEMGEPGRGASIMEEFGAPVLGAAGFGGQEQVQVLTELGKQSFVPVRAGAILRVGRADDNEIVLTDAQASRHHARIEYDGKVYKIIDLNSRNGTFLEDAKLLPGVPETWAADKALRIGKTYLRVVRPQEAEKTAVVSAGALHQAEKEAAAQPSGRISLLLDHDQISVEPGKMVSASLTLLNQGAVVDHFSIAVQGIPAAWVPTQPPVVQLMPGAQQVVNLVISPPRLPTSRAGTYPITFRVTSRDAAAEYSREVKATLTVGAFHQFASELHPQKVRAGRIARLRVENQGNTQEIFDLLWLDRAAELEFKPPQMQLKVSEGKESFAEFRAVPRARALLGGEKTHAFTAEVGISAGGEPQVQSGEIVSRALIPLWVIPLLMLLCLCLLAAAGLGYASMRQSRATATAQATAILAAADPDQDGLTNAQELALGTDPNNPDTDGDGLTDGREINETGTDPKNKDTDGDTLLDGAEVDQIGTSPNNKDTDGDGITDNADANPLSLPTATPIPTPPPYKACPDAFPSRLHIGDHATVSEDPPVANNLRNNPGTEGTEIIGKIDPGEEVEIFDGPQCQNNWVWWKVKVLKSGQVGWTSEGDGTTYWLVPKP
jgi:tRNA A-37 threonylcarbamoyl transferase component Bud32